MDKATCRRSWTFRSGLGAIFTSLIALGLMAEAIGQDSKDPVLEGQLYGSVRQEVFQLHPYRIGVSLGDSPVVAMLCSGTVPGSAWKRDSSGGTFLREYECLRPRPAKESIQAYVQAYARTLRAEHQADTERLGRDVAHLNRVIDSLERKVEELSSRLSHLERK